MIDHDDYAVRLLDLPTDVGGFITESPDGFLNIYINARHSRDQQRRSLRHELRHADADDLHSTDPVSTIEARADLPPLLKARDLVPAQTLPPVVKVNFPENACVVREEAEEVPRSRPPVTPHQAAVILTALTDLDAWFFRESYDY